GAQFFFLQAEDGIRDGSVTGVQTCALPIWRRVSDDQPSRISAVRASPAGGPSGSANPIQKANSTGNSASASAAPARRRRHNNHPAVSSAAQTSRNNTSSGTVVWIPISSNTP